MQNSVTQEDGDSSISECSDSEDPLSFEPSSIEYTCNEAQISDAMAGATAQTCMDHRADMVDQSRASEIGMLKWFSSLTISLSVTVELCLHHKWLSVSEAEYWEQDDEDIEDDFGELSPSQLTPSSPQDREVNTIVWWIVAFISLFQTLHAIACLFLCS